MALFLSKYFSLIFKDRSTQGLYMRVFRRIGFVKTQVLIWQTITEGKFFPPIQSWLSMTFRIIYSCNSNFLMVYSYTIDYYYFFNYIQIIHQNIGSLQIRSSQTVQIQKTCISIISNFLKGFYKNLIAIQLSNDYDSYNNFLWNLKMGALFERLYTRHLITYDPQQWSKRLGEKCSVCQKNLTHEKCISLCKCYYFAHEECFKNEFAKQVYSENTDIRCSQCKAELRMVLCPSFKYSPMLTRWKLLKIAIVLLLFILTVVGILVTLNSDLKIQYAFFILYVEGVALSIILYGLVICVRDIFYRKVVRISQVVSTKMDIQTSAFKDIEMETNEEITKDCLFTNKK